MFWFYFGFVYLIESYFSKIALNAHCPKEVLVFDVARTCKYLVIWFYHIYLTWIFNDIQCLSFNDHKTHLMSNPRDSKRIDSREALNVEYYIAPIRTIYHRRIVFWKWNIDQTFWVGHILLREIEQPRQIVPQPYVKFKKSWARWVAS